MRLVPFFVLVLSSVSVSGLCSTSMASAQPCDVPDVLFVLDRSSSMLDRNGDRTKWHAALDALYDAGNAFLGRARVGLQIFPHPDRCEPGAIVLDPGMHDGITLVEHAGLQPPPTGNYTPMAQTLDVLATHPPLLDPEGDAHVILITDGWQWCHPYDRATRFTPVASVVQLRDLGMTVHVVGFGVGVDALALNRAAVAGGAARPGCDPTLTDPMATGHCYHHARDPEALHAIALHLTERIGAETCNGRDDDCDGWIDEGYDLDGDGFASCSLGDGQPFDCDDENALIFPGAPESCGGRDTNCDGSVDVGCACEPGAVRDCPGSAGVCGGGWQLCVGGVWTACEGGLAFRAERCDGLDDDCDGDVDEEVRCEGGELCLAGECVPIDLPEPTVTEPPDEGRVIELPSAGCTCRTAGSGDWVGALALFALVGMRRYTRGAS